VKAARESIALLYPSKKDDLLSTFLCVKAERRVVLVRRNGCAGFNSFRV